MSMYAGKDTPHSLRLAFCKHAYANTGAGRISQFKREFYFEMHLVFPRSFGAFCAGFCTAGRWKALWSWRAGAAMQYSPSGIWMTTCFEQNWAQSSRTSSLWCSSSRDRDSIDVTLCWWKERGNRCCVSRSRSIRFPLNWDTSTPVFSGPTNTRATPPPRMMQLPARNPTCQRVCVRVCVCESACTCVRMFSVCVCVCVRACSCMHACVCVSERERERECMHLQIMSTHWFAHFDASPKCTFIMVTDYR